MGRDAELPDVLHQQGEGRLHHVAALMLHSNNRNHIISK